MEFFRILARVSFYLVKLSSMIDNVSGFFFWCYGLKIGWIESRKEGSGFL